MYETVTVTLTLRNTGMLPIPWVLLEDLLPRRALAATNPRLKVKGKRLQISMVFRNAEKIISYKLKLLMRGYYQIGPLVLESGDLFGLHRRFRAVTEPHFLLVYPKVVPLHGYELASRRPVCEIRLAHRLSEDPTRIASVLAYQRGNPLNPIHHR